MLTLKLTQTVAVEAFLVALAPVVLDAPPVVVAEEFVVDVVDIVFVEEALPRFGWKLSPSLPEWRQPCLSWRR